MTQSGIRSSTQPVTAVTPSTEGPPLSADERSGADDPPASSTQPVSTAERPAATLPLPGWLATALAVVAVGNLVVLPFALAAAGLNLTEAVDGYYVQSAALFAVLGAVIVAKRRGHVIGWVLVAIGAFDTISRLVDVFLLFTLGDIARGASGTVTATFDEFPVQLTVLAVFGWAWVPSLGALAIALPMLVPDGRLLSSRWRPLAILGVAAMVLLTAVQALVEVVHIPTLVQVSAGILMGLAMLASLVPLVLRFARSRGTERQQLKWVFYGLAFCLPLLALGVLGYYFGIGGYFSIPTFVILPTTITIAVLRYRLYDIDIVINKSLVFLALAGFITAVYAAIVVGVGRLLSIQSGNLGLAIAATALVAVAFEPVRVRVQHWANRLVYGNRATPYEALAAMTARIGDSIDSGAALAEAARLLAQGSGADQAVVWVVQDRFLVPRGTSGVSAVDPAPIALVGAELLGVPASDLVQAVRQDGQLVGALSLRKRLGEGVSTADRRLVEELAGQAALLLANTRLRTRLAGRVSELRESRQRMLAAQDRARHTLERDLHDGAQQELVALKIKLGLAGTIAAREGAADLAARLTQTAVIADEAVETLRDVARGIYPPLLESEGLAAALSAQARRAELSVTLLDRAGRRYPREVEATAYFCAVEALQNAVRHAHAEHAHIELDGTDSGVTVTVTDDGDGFDADSTTYGSGLTHMTDRVDSAGGALVITSRSGHGTTITLTLPTSAGPGSESLSSPPDSTLAGASR